MSAEFCIVHAGDASIVVEFEERIDVTVVSRVASLAARVRAASLPGVLDIVPTFRSVAVHFDPLRADAGRVVDVLTALASEPTRESDETQTPIRVPVCYGGTLGPDLESVAALARLDEATVIALHTACVYRVFMLGFAPGFAYLGTLDPRIGVPRRATPRTRVPAGSVAIAGGQTGVYPLDTPGGWHVIGRTSVRPFDMTRADPFLFKPGNRVEFYAVDRAEYEQSTLFFRGPPAAGGESLAGIRHAIQPRGRRCSSLKYCPIFSVVVPRPRGASRISVLRHDFHHRLLAHQPRIHA